MSCNERRRTRALGQLSVEQFRPLRVEPVERLVEEQQIGLVQERPAEREPLEHAAGEDRDPLVPRAPEPEALEHRAAALAPLGDAVETAVEVEVLECRQLPVDERLVGEEADRAARRVDLELAVRRRRQPGAQAQERRLPGPVRPGDEHEAATRHLEVEPLEDSLVAEPLGQLPSLDHALSLDFRRLRTQACPLVLVLAAVVLSGGCGGETSSERARVSDRSSSGIVFTVNREGWNEIWVMDEDGRKRRRLTDPRPSGSDAAGSMSPVWSPQGDRVAFVSSGDAADEDENLHELYVMNVDSGETRQLTENAARDADPTWSPDGKRIAFVRADYWATDKVETSLRVIEGDGSGEETLAQEDQGVFLGSPAWSPDGKRIAYSRASFAGNSLELTLHVMRSDGSNVIQIADRAAQPAWSPDGKRIAFVSISDRLGETCFHECDPSAEIYVADVSGEHARRLTKSAANETAPAWSPDGKQIVFSSDRSNRQKHEIELYAMPASGGAAKRLTRNEVWDLDPDWR